MTDFYDYEARLARYLNRLEKESFSKQDQHLVNDFEHCRAQGLSAGRLFKLAWTLFAIRRHMKVDFKKADRKDIENLVATINSIPRYPATTKNDLKIISHH